MRVAAQKARNKNLRVLIALGGWTFSDPGPWQGVFPTIAGSAANRKIFVKNLMGFLSQYGFDGVDIDWEYPGADDRGGSPTDGLAYTALMKDISEAFKKDSHGYLLTYTAPTSFWYLRHFDLYNMTRYADWINLMSYDLHGVWDSSNPIGSHVLAHTNLTEIDLALDLLWRVNIPPSKVVLGMGFYGRTFKLVDPNCWQPGCAFKNPDGAGDAGPCTETPGILSYKEITDIIVQSKITPHYDNSSGANYFVYGRDNWVSYDDEKSFKVKIEFANNYGLAGLMIWAVDLDNARGDALTAISGNDDDPLDPLSIGMDNSPSLSSSTTDPSKCRITDCNGSCNNGEIAVGRTSTNDLKDQCNKKDSTQARYICCPAAASPNPSDCAWHDERSVLGLSGDCSPKCNVGDIEVTRDSLGWDGGVRSGSYSSNLCWRGNKIFCCKVGNMAQYLNICSWTECGGDCGGDKPYILTSDAGGPANQNPKLPRCGSWAKGDPLKAGGLKGYRKLCCPAEKSFTGCAWHGGGVCSETCGSNKITLDLDAQGEGGHGYCDNGRQKVFCCDPPGGASNPFTPFDVQTLFPPAYVPIGVPTYELTVFAGTVGLGIVEPNLSGVAFFLIGGSATVVSSLRRRKGGAPGLHFLNCPKDIFRRRTDEKQTARVVCLSKNLDECFGVRKNGVEGTIVEMPGSCGRSSWARAVSLEVSQNQTLPSNIASQGPTSAVYDFSFDYNIGLVRRDGGAISMRIDYSNVPGYWDTVVTSAGNKKRAVAALEDRFFSGKQSDWTDKFNSLKFQDHSSTYINEDLATLMVYEGDRCVSADGDEFGESVAVSVEGRTIAYAYYGFSAVVSWTPGGAFNVLESAGFMKVQGSTSATFKVGSGSVASTLDSAGSMQGETITKKFGRKSIGGTGIYNGWLAFIPWQERDVQFKTSGGNAGTITFDGYMEATIKSDLGSGIVSFPAAAGTLTRSKDQVSYGKDVKLSTVGSTTSGDITLSAGISVGLQIDFTMQKPNQFVTGTWPNMSVHHSVISQFHISENPKETCLTTTMGSVLEGHMSEGTSVGWPSTADNAITDDARTINEIKCFSASSSAKAKRDEDEDEDDDHSNSTSPAGKRLRKRANNSSGFPTAGIDLNSNEDYWKDIQPKMRCQPCGQCVIEGTIPAPCCGCSSIPTDRSEGTPIYGSLDGFGTSPIKRDTGAPWESYGFTKFPDTSSDYQHLEERVSTDTSIGYGTKVVRIGTTEIYADTYPQYPDYEKIPDSLRNFDTASAAANVKKYFQNATNNCMDWDVSQTTTSDSRWVNHVKQKQWYNTEHVLEAQTINRFFDVWLPTKATKKRDTTWIDQYLPVKDPQWGVNYNAAKKIVDQLGSRTKQDRLTVFLAGSNYHKGRLFESKSPVSSDKFNELASGDEQFTKLRELGLIFTYLNNDEVWHSFCDAYNGIYYILQQFDVWYGTTLNPQDSSSLALEWTKHVRAELDMVVVNARANMKMLWTTRKKGVASGLSAATWTLRWKTVMDGVGGLGRQFQKTALKRTDYCVSLPATTVPDP